MKIAVITDLHFAPEPNLLMPKRRGDIADKLLHRALADVTARGADVLVIPGDLVNDPEDTDSLVRLAEILARAPLPQIVIPGNHDPAEDVFYRIVPRPPEHLDIGGFRLTPYCDEQTAGYNARRSGADLRRQHEMRRGFDGFIISIQHVPLFEPGAAECYHYDNASEIFASRDFDGAISGHKHSGLPPLGKTVRSWCVPSLCEEPFRYALLDFGGGSSEPVYSLPEIGGPEE